MYQIKLTKKAKKELKILKKFYQSAIDFALEELKEDPAIGKPLVNELKGYFSYRIGVYRIIYKISKEDKIIIILTAGHRATIYSRVA